MRGWASRGGPSSIHSRALVLHPPPYAKNYGPTVPHKSSRERRGSSGYSTRFYGILRCPLTTDTHNRGLNTTFCHPKEYALKRNVDQICTVGRMVSVLRKRSRFASPYGPQELKTSTLTGHLTLDRVKGRLQRNFH